MDGWIEELIADDQERTKVLLKKGVVGMIPQPSIAKTYTWVPVQK